MLLDYSLTWLDAQFAMPVEDQALLERLGTAELLIEYEEGATGQGAKWSALREMRPYSYLNADPKSLLKFLDFSQGIAWEERIRPAREVISASSIRAVHAYCGKMHLGTFANFLVSRPNLQPC